MVIFHDNLGGLLSECRHSGFYCSKHDGRGATADAIRYAQLQSNITPM